MSVYTALCTRTVFFNVMLQKRAAMRAVSVFLVLVVVTAHTSLARRLNQCQLLAELRRHGVPGHELATCEFNALELYVFISHETSVCVSNFPK
jgi:hypothetical protein